ncbi:MAG TPA: amino acid adenylation domain-containing protein [Solirubrobacteraceae bacterium]|jgi:amino acid adenylation domain-containing protein|nr:amino acid adenylation domain-containing protein [Solirubrobacteraceae bacterium]
MTDTSLAQRLARLSPEQRAELARTVREKNADGNGRAAIPRIDRSSGRLPMSSAQRRLYFLQRLHPESPAYNVVEAFRLRGALDVETVRSALQAVVARHEVLRTTCSMGDGEPVALVRDEATVDLEVVDVRAAELAGLLAARVEVPFDLDREPPLRVTLARIADDDHALLILGHHIASDAWSCRLLAQELFRHYAAAVAGGDPGLQPLAIQYADFAAWQQSRRGSDEARGHLAYWRERLAGMPPLLELPLEHPRPAVRSDRGSEIRLELDGDVRRRLHAAARDEGITPFALLLTAFGHVLHRHCDSDDVVVGTPVSGRDRPELEPVLGCFINTVPLRLDFGEVPTRRDLVRRVWERTLDDLDHQALPFEDLVAELSPERDLSAGPLVQALFNLYPATRIVERVPGLELEPLDVPRARAKFDLTCTVVDHGDALRVTLDYATDLLQREQVRRLGEHFVATVEDLLSGLDAPAGTLAPVPPGEAAPRAPDRASAGRAVPLLERFEAHARAHPERTAIAGPHGAVEYGELNRRANRLARRLEPATGPVALLFERSIDYVAAMLAAMKAGLSYVPLDPAMPPSHVAAVLEAADARVVLTHADVQWGAVAAAAPPAASFVALEEIAGELAGFSGADLGRPVDPSEAMYVVFTSGSTGRPKGVVVEHRHFARYLDSLLARLAIPDGLSFAIVSTFAADLGLTNLYGALATGGTLHVLPYEWATDPDRFADYFRRHRIDVMKLVPSHLQAIAEAGRLGAVVPARHLVLAGEACPWGLVDAVRDARPECKVWNHYGPTETTVSVLGYEVPAEPPSPRGATVPLGFPFDHVRVHVVDRRLRPVPRGAPGELLIAGDSVARGYLAADDAREPRFVPDPFSADPGARAYRSGDRVRVRADGAIEFLGRLDRQAKIRGYRVEPSHVEAVLRRHPGVADVAVAVRDDGADGARLVAYVVPAPGGDGAAPLRDHARSALPPYMVPAAFVQLDRLPLTPNGKLDWHALPEPDPEAMRDGPRVPPRHARDAQVAAVWAEVLGLDELGIDDDFFASGGDSFAAMRAARRLGEGVRVVSIFQHPTVRELVDFLDDEGDGQGCLFRLPGRGDGSATATASVVAVPYGGGTAAAYADLARALPAELPLYAVELPGHDAGAGDGALEPFDTIAVRCAEEIRARIDGPIVVYGHCVGAALAYEIARLLEADGADVVGVVFAGAFPSPRLPGRLFDLWARLLPVDRLRSDRLYRDLLRATGGLTEEIDPAEEALRLRALKHDGWQSQELYTRLCHDPDRRRTLHALTVVGERDRVTEFHEERYREWNLLCADTALAVIPDAGHYFLKHQADQLAEIVAGWTEQRLAAGDAPAPNATADPPSTNLRGFAAVTLGQLVSQTGSRALAFALGVWVYLQTGSVTQFSAILVTGLLPGLLALPFAGAAADRWSRRGLMLAGELTNAAGTGFVLVAYATGSLHLWQLYVAAGLASIATALQQPAYLAAVAQLVPKQYLARANGVQQTVVAVSQAAGPLIGGTLVALMDIGSVMVVDLATVVFAVLTLVAVRFPSLLFRKREESIWREIGGGWQYIARRRSLVDMVVFFLGFNLLFGFAIALIPPMVLAFGSPATLSLAALSGAIGGILGGALMALWGGAERRATGMIGFVALTGAGMVVAGLAPSPIFPILGLAAMMASVALINGHWQTMIHVKVGMELHGRVLATNRMVANLTEPIGYVGAGLLADSLLEPAMADGGWLSDAVGGALGSGPGRGMAVALVLLGGMAIALAAIGLRWRTLRYMEDALPDAPPGAIVTWDRDRLQEEADALLAAAGR